MDLGSLHLPLLLFGAWVCSILQVKKNVANSTDWKQIYEDNISGGILVQSL